MATVVTGANPTQPNGGAINPPAASTAAASTAVASTAATAAASSPAASTAATAAAAAAVTASQKAAADAAVAAIAANRQTTEQINKMKEKLKQKAIETAAWASGYSTPLLIAKVISGITFPISLTIAMSVASHQYLKHTILAGLTPNPLTFYVLMAIGIDMVMFTALVGVLLGGVAYTEKEAVAKNKVSTFTLLKNKMAVIAVDFAVASVVKLAMLLPIASTVSSDSYYDYSGNGLRAIASLRSMLLPSGTVLSLVPYGFIIKAYYADEAESEKTLTRVYRSINEYQAWLTRAVNGTSAELTSKLLTELRTVEADLYGITKTAKSLVKQQKQSGNPLMKLKELGMSRYISASLRVNGTLPLRKHGSKLYITNTASPVTHQLEVVSGDLILKEITDSELDKSTDKTVDKNMIAIDRLLLARSITLHLIENLFKCMSNVNAITDPNGAAGAVTNTNTGAGPTALSANDIVISDKNITILCGEYKPASKAMSNLIMNTTANGINLALVIETTAFAAFVGMAVPVTGFPIDAINKEHLGLLRLLTNKVIGLTTMLKEFTEATSLSSSEDVVNLNTAIDSAQKKVNKAVSGEFIKTAINELALFKGSSMNYPGISKEEVISYLTARDIPFVKLD